MTSLCFLVYTSTTICEGQHRDQLRCALAAGEGLGDVGVSALEKVQAEEFLRKRGRVCHS